MTKSKFNYSAPEIPEKDAQLIKEFSEDPIANKVALLECYKPNIWVPHFSLKKLNMGPELYDVNYLADCVEDVYKWNTDRYGVQCPDLILTINLLVEEGNELRDALLKIVGKDPSQYLLKEVDEVLDAYGDLTFVYYGFISRMLKDDSEKINLLNKQRQHYLPVIKGIYKAYLFDFINTKFFYELGQFCMAYHTEILCAVCTSNNTKQITKANASTKVNSGKKGKGPNFKEPDFKRITKHWKSFENLIGRYNHG